MSFFYFVVYLLVESKGSFIITITIINFNAVSPSRETVARDGKVWEHVVAVCRCGRSSPVTLAFEPVVKINQPVWKNEQLDELCANCPHPGPNSGQWIHSQTC